MILPFLSSILSILAFFPANFYPVSFVFLIPLFIFFLKEEKFWRLVLGTFIFKFIFFLGTVYYTLEPIIWLWGLFIFSGLPISVFLFKKFCDIIYRKYFPDFSKNQFCFLPILIFLPFAWTFFDHLEAILSITPTYIATAGNALGSSPFLGLASFGGTITLTFFVAFINAFLVGIILNNFNIYCHSRPDRESSTFLIKKIIDSRFCGNDKCNIILLSSLILFFFSVWQISKYELHKNSINYGKLPHTVEFAAISAARSFGIGYLPTLENYLSQKTFELIIFPENILDQPVLPPKIRSASFGNNISSTIFENTAKKFSANLLAAFDTRQNNDGLKYNSAILFDSQGKISDLHNKNRLMFIGEYWPLGNWHPSFYDWLRKKDPSTEDYAIFNQKNAYQKGERNLMMLNIEEKKVPFAAAICSEIHYPNDLKKYRDNGARFIVNQSSNRWIDAGLNHFLYLTENLKKIESVWLSLPIISSGVDDNAGIVLPDGSSHKVPYGKKSQNFGIYSGEIKY